jgi:hypothetical protein
VSKSAAHIETKLLKLKPYRTTMVHQLLPPDAEARINYCRWFQQSVYDGMVDPDLVFYTNEAWFYLGGYVNSQNNYYWSAEKPLSIHEVPLHDVKIRVWCAISAYRIIGPVFFQETINSERYVRLILTPLFRKLTEDKKTYGYFMQDNTTAHTANHSMNEINQVFGDCVVSRGLWPPRSPDLNLCDFYLWGKLKDKVYVNNPHTHTLDELKDNIC